MPSKTKTRRSKRTRKPRMRQLHFDHLKWGGFREGAGRPKKKGSTSHLSRPLLASRYPVHVTVKIAPNLPSLRKRRAFAALRRAFARGRQGTKELGGFRLVHFSVQSNHVHLIVEGKDRVHISRGMQGLQVRMAKALNRVWSRRGKVFPERYFEHILRTPREVRNAIAYLLGNAFKHQVLRYHPAEPKDRIHDTYTSGAYLQGWKKGWQPAPPRGPTFLTAPGTWLMRVGWRRHGLFPAVG